jgi:hypothetical protein
MTVNTRVEVAGINEAIRGLNKIEPGLRKQFALEATRIAEPAISEAQNRYAQKGWGMSRAKGVGNKWAGPAVAGRKAFPWNPGKAISGVKVKLDADRRKLATILLVQSDFATAILETAGRKDKNPLGDALKQPLKPTTTRILGPALYSKKRQVEGEMSKAAMKVVNRVNKEIN